MAKYCARYGQRFTVVSVDIDPAANPTHVSDIRTWIFGRYPPNSFDIIWASPPCTAYSCANTRGHRDMEDADSIVLHVMKIISYFLPSVYFIENPATGMLKDRPYVQGIPFYDVDYCKYSDYGYRKRTRIYTKLAGFEPQLCSKDCGSIVNGRHVNTFGGWQAMPVGQKHRVPTALLHMLFSPFVMGKMQVLA